MKSGTSIEIGKVILKDRFLIEEKLGSGSQATVYKACEYDALGNRKIVALKVIERGGVIDSVISQLKEECNIGTTLTHPNVMKIYDLLYTPTHFFISCEYCDSDTVFHKLGTITESNAIKILQGICTGYNELYKNHIIHNDMKSLNVLLTKDSDGNLIPKISDFGFAFKIYEEIRLTDFLVTNKKGTRTYKSPEKLSGKPHNYQDDIYAIGVIFYEMIFNRKPFAFDESDRMMKDMEIGEFDMDTSKLSKESASFILGCLRFNEADRFRMCDILAHPLLNPPVVLHSFDVKSVQIFNIKTGKVVMSK